MKIRLAIFLIAMAGSGAIATNGEVREVKDIPPEIHADDRSRFIVGNALWTLVHEISHALIHELDMIVLGREEDAADLIASIALLHGTDDHPHGVREAELVAEAAQGWRLEWRIDQLNDDPAAYWDGHSLDIQRYYNIVCLLHARRPEVHASRPHLELHSQRALACDDYEYEQAASSVARMLDTYGRPEGEQGGAEISVVFEDPGIEAHGLLGDLVRRSGIADHVAELSPELFKLPRPIDLVFAPCFGDETAYWRSDRQEIVFCYELLARFDQLYDVQQCLEESESKDESALLSCLPRGLR